MCRKKVLECNGYDIYELTNDNSDDGVCYGIEGAPGGVFDTLEMCCGYCSTITPGPNIKKHDPVNNPKHFTIHPSGVECITIAEWMGFNLGNAIKYIWRAGLRSEDFETDLKKAIFYIEREIGRLKSVQDKK